MLALARVSVCLCSNVSTAAQAFVVEEEESKSRFWKKLQMVVHVVQSLTECRGNCGREIITSYWGVRGRRGNWSHKACELAYLLVVPLLEVEAGAGRDQQKNFLLSIARRLDKSKKKERAKKDNDVNKPE